MNNLLFWLEGKVGAWLLKQLKKTVKFRVEGQPADDFRCMYMFWHRNLLLLTLQRMNSGVAVLVSSSKDGELIARPIAELGYLPVRGSSSRQGSKALKEMIRLSRECSLAITPDGPKGPSRSIHPGIFQLAFMGRIPIIPTVAECDKEWVFNSWDRFRLPKPWSHIHIIYGEPFYVEDKADFTAAEERLQQIMKELEEKLAESK